ncbi:cytochrome b [Pseudooceanicola sp. 200-1SW]|uniref:cytochrome b n=1 Tax=Pseudooceanicola sp. 200-1SW TaxID=3425949 RepID=UPI003D7F7E92
MDDPTRYGLVSRLFHWAMAALLLYQIIGMMASNALGRSSAVAAFVGPTHQPLGVLLMVLVVLRLIWAVLNAARRPAQERGPLGLLAKAGHGLLYLLMLLVPAVALLRAWGGTRGLEVFGVQVFAPREVAIDWATAPAAAHGPLALLMLLLILGHAGAAIWHKRVKRDDVMARMIG